MKTRGQQHQAAVVGYKHGSGKKKARVEKPKKRFGPKRRKNAVVSGNASIINSECSCNSAICPTCLIRKGNEENRRRIENKW